jgi:hypothetical protein
MKKLIALSIAVLVSSSALAADPVKVTVDNYDTVETSRQFEIQIENAGGVNKLDHFYGTTKVDKQPIIRLNQDTIYSMGIVDATKGGEIVIPEVDGRFVSVRFHDEDHYGYDETYGPGSHPFPEYDGHMYVSIRIGAREVSDKEDAAVYELQKQIKVNANSNTPFDAIEYDADSLKEMHKKLLDMFNSGKYNPRVFFTTKEDAAKNGTELEHTIGAAIGWGGGTVKGTVWDMIPHSEDMTCQSTTFEDPKNHGFWSITVYNAEGFLFAPNNVNSYSAEPNADGTYTVHFGCEGKKNNIDIENESGKWNAIVRSYAPSQMVIDGKWNPLNSIKRVIKNN